MVYTGGTVNRSQTVGTVQHRTGSSRRYTESHTADGHHSRALRTEVVKHVVHRKSIFRNFVHCLLKAGNERPIQTLNYGLNNTVNADGGRSIQRIKLVQQVKDRTQRLSGGHSTGRTNSRVLRRTNSRSSEPDSDQRNSRGSGATISDTSALNKKHERQRSGEQHLAAEQSVVITRGNSY